MRIETWCGGGSGGSWERPVWTIGREMQRQGSWRTRQPVQQNLRSSRTLESSQEQETTPVPGWSSQRTTSSQVNQDVPVWSPPLHTQLLSPRAVVIAGKIRGRVAGGNRFIQRRTPRCLGPHTVKLMSHQGIQQNRNQGFLDRNGQRQGLKNAYGHSLVPATAPGTRKPHLVKQLCAPYKGHGLRAGGEQSMRRGRGRNLGSMKTSYLLSPRPLYPLLEFIPLPDAEVRQSSSHHWGLGTTCVHALGA